MLVAALLIARLKDSAASLEPFGIKGRRAQHGAVVLVAVVGSALAAGVAAGWDAASYAAAALAAGFAGALTWAAANGGGGLPCPCFGGRSRIGFGTAAHRGTRRRVRGRAGPRGAVSPSRDAWVIAGLGIALAGVLVLGVAVLALAREVAALRLRLPPDSALEILSEAPRSASERQLLDRLPLGPHAQFALAVFTSEGCRLCRCRPAVDAIDRDPLVYVAVFDEYRDAGVWEALAVPRAAGTPSPSTVRAPSAPRAPSAALRSSRASWPPPSGASADAVV